MPNHELDYTHALLTPGQGNQRVGMGLDLAKRSADARAVWEMADKVLLPQLGFKLTDRVWNGTEQQVQATEIAQLAITTDSLARTAALKEAGLLGKPGWHAGNSVGMITALVNAGSLTIEGAVGLARGRGEAFRLAMEQGPKTTMVALIDVERAVMLEGRERFELVTCLINSDKQIVLGGPLDNVQAASAFFKEKAEEDKVFPLSVDAAFHSKYMEPAVDMWAEIVGQVPVEAPTNGRIVGGSSASELVTPEDIRRQLIAQLTTKERYRDVVWFLRARGVTTMTELNSSTRLTKINMENFGIADDPRPFSAISLPRTDTDKAIVLGYRLVNPRPEVMSRDEITAWYMDWLANRQGMDPGEFSEDMEFVGDAGLESIDLKALRAALKNKFGKVVPDDEAAENTTIVSAIEATYRLANSADLEEAT